MPAAFPLAVSGIRVELWDKDGGLDDFLGSTTTDDDGRFTINFSNTQGSEGSYLELYLKFEATTPGGVIRVIKRIGITRNGTCGQSNPTDLSYNTHTLNLGDVGPSHDDVKPHLLHYAWQSRRFLERNGMGNVLPNSQSQPLKIMISPVNAKQNNAFFIPGGYRNTASGALIVAFGRFGFIGLGAGAVTAAGLTLYLSNEDCLYIGENRETEEVAYHEFGHYLMWHMQNRSWSDLAASFAKHRATTNSNPKLAWTEGWADGFSRIMDAYTVRYDRERDRDDNAFSNEVREPLDTRRQRVLRNGIVNDEFTLTHGVLSEYFISTTIYDLWDGASNLALRSNSPISATTTGSGAPTGSANPFTAFDENYLDNPFQRQNILDEVGLSFADLTAPIRSHQGSGSFSAGLSSAAVVQDITQFYRYLLQSQSDCEQRRLIANVFLINRISDFPFQSGLPPDAPAQRLGTDELQRELTLTEPLFKFDDDDDVFYQDDIITFSIALDQNELAGTRQRYNLASTAPGSVGSLSDPLTVRDGAVLGIHFGTERGYPGSGQPTPASSNFSAGLCGRFRLTLAADGRLEVGDESRANTAEATVLAGGLVDIQGNGAARVGNGSVLRFGAGAALVVRNGATLTVNGAVRLENGSFLCVEPGANLVFAPGSELYVDAGANLGLPAAFGLPALACSSELAVCGNLTGNNPSVINTATRNEALAFDGVDDVVTIPTTNSYVNSLGAQFAIEAFVRPDNLLRGGSQVIFSNRRDNAAKTYGVEGAMLTLADGYLLLQLDGVNFGYGQAATLLPNDGGCHHVAVSRDAANRLRFFIDGQFVYTPASPTSRLPTSSGPLSLGADNRSGFGFGEFFPGLIGEVRVWNSSRTDDQIRRNVSARLSAPQSGLVAYYDMQDPTGPQISDGSAVTASGNALSPGTLGAPGSGNADQPAWLSRCALSCTVQGNMRTAANAAPLGEHRGGSVGDTLGDARRQLPALANPSRAMQLLAKPSVWPNPAQGTATLRFELTEATAVRVQILDLAGTERAALPTAKHLAGQQEIILPVRGLPPGFYLVSVESPHGRQLVRLQLF